MTMLKNRSKLSMLEAVKCNMECAICIKVVAKRRRVIMATLCTVSIILSVLFIVFVPREVELETYYAHFGPKYLQSKGEVWPSAQQENKSKTVFFVYNSTIFNITVKSQSCNILKSAITRYKRILRDFGNSTNRNGKCSEIPTKGKNYTRTLEIWLTSKCEKYPHYDMNEEYNLTVGRTSVLKSSSIWGVLRGLETFAQLFYLSDDYCETRINKTVIFDYPVYKHRGLLIDTGRHYLSLASIYKTIDALSINKMNVLHWHIVDDESFPYQSERFPSLSEKGAFSPALVYTKADIQNIVQYARDRGVRVIPEMDVPGHTFSWGQAYPELLTECYNNGKLNGRGPMNPIKNETYTFLKELLLEVHQWFPDEFLHIGGDEVNPNCWKSNPEIKQFIKKHNMPIKLLQKYFLHKAMTMLPNKTRLMVWQEVFDENAIPLEKTHVQVWWWEWVDEMIKIIKAGHYVIFSASWYLNYKNAPWTTYYTEDPRKMVYTKTKSLDNLNLIVGGEACLWGEMVDDTNIHTKTWPRTSAIAERLWKGLDLKSGNDNPVTDKVRERMEEHVCRLRRRGIPAEPASGPNFCYGDLSI